MKCKICKKVLPHARALGEHHRVDHPAEFRERQKAKRARERRRSRVEEANAPPDDVITLEGENELLVNTANAWERAGLEQPAYDRIASYLSNRFGVPAGAE